MQLSVAKECWHPTKSANSLSKAFRKSDELLFHPFRRASQTIARSTLEIDGPAVRICSLGSKKQSAGHERRTLSSERDQLALSLEGETSSKLSDRYQPRAETLEKSV